MDGRKQSQCQSEKAEEDQPRLGLPPGEARRMDGVEILYETRAVKSRWTFAKAGRRRGPKGKDDGVRKGP